MNNTFTNMSRVEETSATARGPHNPLAISQPLKLKSLLKGSIVEYIIVKANVKEKSRRPMSSSTVSKRPLTGDRKMNSSFVGREALGNSNYSSNQPMNNTTGSMAMGRMMNNFMADNDEEKENQGSNIVKNYRSNTGINPMHFNNSNINIPLPANKMPVNRPRSNQSSELRTKIFNKRTTSANSGYGINGFMRDQSNNNNTNIRLNSANKNKDLRDQVKNFQNFSNPWANSSFKNNGNDTSEQAASSQPMIKAKKNKKNSITSSDRRILSKINSNNFSIRGNSPGGRLIYK